MRCTRGQGFLAKAVVQLAGIALFGDLDRAACRVEGHRPRHVVGDHELAAGVEDADRQLRQGLNNDARGRFRLRAQFELAIGIAHCQGNGLLRSGERVGNSGPGSPSDTRTCTTSGLMNEIVTSAPLAVVNRACAGEWVACVTLSKVLHAASASAEAQARSAARSGSWKSLLLRISRVLDRGWQALVTRGRCRNTNEYVCNKLFTNERPSTLAPDLETTRFACVRALNGEAPCSRKIYWHSR